MRGSEDICGERGACLPYSVSKHARQYELQMCNGKSVQWQRLYVVSSRIHN